MFLSDQDPNPMASVTPGTGTNPVAAVDLTGDATTNADSQTPKTAPTDSNSADVTSTTKSSTEVDLTEAVRNENILNYFRSYNYLFTLSALPNSVYFDPTTNVEEKYKAYKSKYVVASSVGKGGFKMPSPNGPSDQVIDNALNLNDQAVQTKAESTIAILTENRDYVNLFNQQSPGRFDFYFEDVNLKATMTTDARVGFASFTSLEFTLLEPYGLGGLYEALTAAARAAGNVNYQSTVFLFTVEFKGFPQWDDMNPVSIEPATRYFAISFRGIAMKATEQGTKYTCTASPIGDIAMGYPNTLKTSLNIVGKTVGEILDNMMESLTKIERDNQNGGKSTNNTSTPTESNTYKIVFPLVDELSFNFDEENENWRSSKVADLTRDNANYKFKDPTDPDAPKGQRVKYNPEVTSVAFSQNANVHDCIAAILRDSDIVKKIFENLKPDATGHIDYFRVGIEVKPKPTWNEKANRPFYEYLYYVVPYKVHYTRVPGYQNELMAVEAVQPLIRRRYNYLYTGKNVDILTFDIKYDYLFYGSIPLREGNQPELKKDLTQSTVGSGESDKQLGDLKTAAEIKKQKVTNSPAVRLVNPEMGRVLNAGESTRGLQSDAYSNLVKSLHDSLLRDPGMARMELTILGDPFYISQSGVGNIRTIGDLDYPGITTNGGLDHEKGPVYIEIKFRTPNDINSFENQGSATMSWSDVSEFSGIWMVSNVTSLFQGGVFKQVMDCARIQQRADIGATTDSSTKAIPTVWATAENQSNAETARLARQNAQ